MINWFRRAKESRPNILLLTDASTTDRHELPEALLREPSAHVLNVVESLGYTENSDSYQNLHNDAMERLHARMMGFGPFDAIYVICRKHHGFDVTLSRMVFHHLRPGGVLHVAEPMAAGEWASVPSKESVSEMFARVYRYAQLVPPPKKTKGRDDLALGAATESITVRDGWVEITRRDIGPIYAKIREQYFNDLCASAKYRESVSVIETLPGSNHVSRIDFRTNRSDLNKVFRWNFNVPELSLREYRDAIYSPGQFVTISDLVAPDSHRHMFYFTLENVRAKNVTHLFAQHKSQVGDLEYLRGSYFMLDSEWPSHFGHVVTEQLARLWALNQTLKRHPDLKYLISTKDGSDELQEWQLELFGAAGISRDRIVVRNVPAKIELLVGATPMFSQPTYADPRLVEMYKGFGRKLVARASLASGMGKRIFVSRKAELTRPCANIKQVEDYFVQRGYSIIFPEEHSVPDQVAIFQNATHVAGFAGSGLFHFAFCEDSKDVVVICSETYDATNEFLYASIRGDRLNYVWCPSSVEKKSSAFDPKVFHAEFRVDFERDGEYLDEITS